MIDQAIGIIRSRSGVSAEEAFERLTRLSQNENMKLHLRRRTDGGGGGAPSASRPAAPSARQAAVASSAMAASIVGPGLAIGHEPPSHLGQVFVVGARVAAQQL